MLAGTVKPDPRVQLLPLTPFGPLNYAAAIAKLPVARYMFGIAVGIIPGTLVDSFVGDRFIAGVLEGNIGLLLLALAIPMAAFGLTYLPTLIRRVMGGERQAH